MKNKLLKIAKKIAQELNDAEQGAAASYLIVREHPQADVKEVDKILKSGDPNWESIEDSFFSYLSDISPDDASYKDGIDQINDLIERFKKNDPEPIEAWNKTKEQLRLLDEETEEGDDEK